MYSARQAVFPDMFNDLKSHIGIGVEWLDGLMEGKSFLCGDRFTFADIILYCALDFAHGVELAPANIGSNIERWFNGVNARPTAAASLHEEGTAAGFRGV